MDRRSVLTGAVVASGLAWRSRQVAADDKKILPTRPLGKTGVKATVLALGGYTGMKEPRSDKFDPVEMADAAIDAGIRYFDTAPSYGNGQSERNYGDAARQAAAGDLIRYVLGLPIAVAVVGMSSLEQLQINVAAARKAPFDEQQREALETRMAAVTS